MRFLQTALLLFVSFPIFSQSTIIKDVNLIDVAKGKVIYKTSVRITDGTIHEITSFKRIQRANSDAILEAENKYLIPGLIDTHIHFFQSGGLYTRPDAIDLREKVPYTEEIQFNKDHAQDYLSRYLRNGITTVMDLGGPLWNYKVRDSIGPSALNPGILVTGPLFSMVDREQMDEGDPPIIKVTNKEEILALFNKQLPYKPDFIKVWYVVNQQNPAIKNYPLVAYLGELCQQNNLQLIVHATQLHTAKLAVKAGASVLVHSVDDSIIPSSFIKELKKKKVTYIPTMIVTNGYLKTFTGKIQHHPQDLAWANPTAYNSLLDPKNFEAEDQPPVLQRMYGNEYPSSYFKRDSIKRINLLHLSKAGVNIATGTDAGNIGTMHGSSYLEELEEMSNSGMSNQELLVSSTLNAAKGFRLADKIGSIDVGKQADLVLLNKNPLEDIRNITSIHHVIKSGHVLTPDAIIKETPVQIVQKQVNAYNARDIDAFMDTYAKDIRIYNEKDELIMNGHEEMRERYAQMFSSIPDLYCHIKNRMQLNNRVIDQEKVLMNGKYVQAIAVYLVENGKIKQVRFVR